MGIMPDERTRSPITYVKHADGISHIVLRDGQEALIVWPFPADVMAGDRLVLLGRNGALVGVEYETPPVLN